MEGELLISTQKVLGNTERKMEVVLVNFDYNYALKKEKPLHLRVNEKFSLIKSQNSLTFTNFSLKLEAMSQHRSFNALPAHQRSILTKTSHILVTHAGI